jgi:glutathione synthase/RimK-type ligase-like ATP-grasp enzyme
MPATVQVNRGELRWLIQGHCDLADMLPQGAFPLIIRPLDSHAGHGLEKVASLEALDTYLAGSVEHEFFISPFVDYKSADGLFRKYRVVLIDGVPFAGHMGISSHWMIHYLNAGMTESAEKRAQEEQFMRHFDDSFAMRHASALRALSDHFGLEYLVIDCAETAAEELLVFEVDPGAVIHSMDPPTLFPYKAAQMQKVFAAFRAMLQRVASGTN